MYGKEYVNLSPLEMEELKVRELALMERNATNYYRCKIRHQQLYANITTVYAPYITKEMLVMLHHNNDMQMNEAINTSVAKYAPKGKTYYAAGVHNVGKHEFWKRSFHTFNIPLDLDYLTFFMVKMFVLVKS